MLSPLLVIELQQAHQGLDKKLIQGVEFVDRRRCGDIRMN
jgi:hypothetical protein